MLDPHIQRRGRGGFLSLLRTARKDATADRAAMALAVGVTTLMLYYALPAVAFALSIVPLSTAAMLGMGAAAKTLRQRRPQPSSPPRARTTPSRRSRPSARGRRGGQRLGAGVDRGR